jgi:branched-chain amino acid transport system permease protein
VAVINITKTGTDYRKEVALVRDPGQWLILLLSLAVLIILPYILKWTGSANWFTFINVTFITIIALLGLNIITGMAGQVSLGHAAFIMVGAYSAGILIKEFNWPFWGAMPVSALISAATGMIVGAPSLRLKGFYLAVATLAFFLIAQFILRRMSLSGGLNGLMSIPAPSIGNFKIESETGWYYLILVLMLIFIFFSVNLTRSRLGRAFFAVRDNDTTAASLGIQPYAIKLKAFFIGSLFAGVAGSLLACYLTVVRPEMFTMWDSIWYLGMIVIGGAGSTSGPIMGVIFLRLISQILQLISMSDFLPSIGSSTWVYITSGIYGLVIILFVSFQPYGLLGLWRKFKAKYKFWPFNI